MHGHCDAKPAVTFPATVFISHLADSRSLSWSEWLVAYQDGIPVDSSQRCWVLTCARSIPLGQTAACYNNIVSLIIVPCNKATDRNYVKLQNWSRPIIMWFVLTTSVLSCHLSCIIPLILVVSELLLIDDKQINRLQRSSSEIHRRFVDLPFDLLILTHFAQLLRCMVHFIACTN